MSKVHVMGSSPGMMRVSVEGTDLTCEISTALPAYTAVQELAAFMTLLFEADARHAWIAEPDDMLPEPPEPPRKGKSIAPKGEK